MFRTKEHLQLNKYGFLRHFVSIAGLRREHLSKILETAVSFTSTDRRAVKKVPLLRGKTVVNLFFETSTRTRSTFELAAKRLSADVLNLSIPFSAVQKGESLLDTMRNIQAMSVDMFVIRHAISGSLSFIVSHCPHPAAIVNAGDGCHEHPTQAMLDMFTIQQHKGDLAKLRVAVIGDVVHSRVARSQIAAMRILGVRDLRLIGPKTLVPSFFERMGTRVFHDCNAGLAGVDVVIVLRLQRERMHGGFLPSEREYFRCYGLDSKRMRLAEDDAIVMHPGPVNRGVEMSSEVADGEQSVILSQVNNGIAVRMAVMALVIDGQRNTEF